ncbi:hypothetical protein OG21DRAFT_1522914 [Imleria badia]|nr:hypothetical protein OG21DRAFT_1522914 [Imleria badia]
MFPGPWLIVFYRRREHNRCSPPNKKGEALKDDRRTYHLFFRHGHLCRRWNHGGSSVQGPVKVLRTSRIKTGSIVIPRVPTQTLCSAPGCNFPGSEADPWVASRLAYRLATPGYDRFSRELSRKRPGEYIPPDDQLEIARMLYAAGCDPRALEDRGLSPLHLAIQSLSREFVQWFIQSGFQLPLDAILYTAPRVFPGPASTLRNFTPFWSFSLSMAEDAHVCNALHLVSSHICGFDGTSAERVVWMLVEHGCNVNGHKDAGETPLQITMSSRLSLHALGVFMSLGAELPVDILNSGSDSLAVR